jgi:hypothetical protein
MSVEMEPISHSNGGTNSQMPTLSFGDKKKRELLGV